jgi:hypothetical protein
MSAVVQREWWKTCVKSCCRPLTQPSPVSGSARLGSFRQVLLLLLVPPVRACVGFDHALWLSLRVPGTFVCGVQMQIPRRMACIRSEREVKWC